MVERPAGIEPVFSVWKTDVSAESTTTAWHFVRRPYGARTRDLLAENQVSCQLAPTAHGAGGDRGRAPAHPPTCPPPDLNGVLGGLHSRALPVTPGGHRYVEKRGLEPLASDLPRRRSPSRATSPRSGTGVSNPVSLAPKASGSAVSLVPEVLPPGRPVQAPAGVSLMPSTVELRIISAAGRGRGENAGATGLEPAIFGFGDRCSTS